MIESTVSSSVCADAPGYTVDTTMVGGATVGYCAIGSLVMETLPITRMNSAITHAKTGRSMKNFAIVYFFAAEAGCQGAVFTAAPGRIFWKPSTTTCSPGFRPSRITQLPACWLPTFTGRGPTL